jgi:hypothetical protein
MKKVTLDSLKDGSEKEWRDNKMLEFFRWLARCLTTKDAEETILNRERRLSNASHLSTSSELSTSSNENNPEDVSRWACMGLFTSIYDVAKSIAFPTAAEEGGDGLVVYCSER